MCIRDSPGGVSHFTRALKAFRALRLINLSSLMRDTFHAVMIAGAGYILDASILALLYIIPYAVWGQNLFAGLLYSCTDSSDNIVSKLDCHGEYMSQPLAWSYLAPRAWSNPSEGSMYSFDDFKSALLILFEVVSLEGWVDVMRQAMSIIGRDLQPRPDASQYNAIFFLVYNLVGAVSVLALFVSVIIENFQRYSGAAYLTTEQRQWLDMKRQLQRQAASRRPANPPSNAFVRWCYQASTHKRGWWSRAMSVLYLVVLVLLMSQSFSDTWHTEQARSIVYSVLGFVFACDLLIRLIGLGVSSFRRSYWNWYAQAHPAQRLTRPPFQDGRRLRACNYRALSSVAHHVPRVGHHACRGVWTDQMGPERVACQEPQLPLADTHLSFHDFYRRGLEPVHA